jgi:tRNA-dihydrouridine synthase
VVVMGWSKPFVLRGRLVSPSLFLAPMAGVSHSALRRLVADFGGYGALYSEMLSPTALMHENLTISPFTRRRPHEGAVIYQLRLSGSEDVGAVIDRLATIDPFAIDINLGCPAPEIRKRAAGVALFRDARRLETVLSAVRRRWEGPLLVKCRLGDDTPGWRDEFKRRLGIFEHCGIDAVAVHPRFAGEKLKRHARWELFAWIAAESTIPLIANGDIGGAEDVGRGGAKLEAAGALMVGRMAVVKPWIFRELGGEQVAVDYREVWERYYAYVLEDFPPEKAIGRLKEFSSYYARNFFFGHELYRAVQGACSLDVLRQRALAFLSRDPRLTASPSVAGL